VGFPTAWRRREAVHSCCSLGTKNGIKARLGCKAPQEDRLPFWLCVCSVKFTVAYAEGVASQISHSLTCSFAPIQARAFGSPFYPRLLGCIISNSPHGVLFIPHLSNPSTPPSPAFRPNKPLALLSTPSASSLTFVHLLLHLPRMPLLF